MHIRDTIQRRQLERSGRLHWYHVAVVLMSLTLTLGAWHIARSQVEDKVERQFDRESSHVIELVQERMRKYEDALWGGVALWDTFGTDVDYNRWAKYAQRIRIDIKYPGINGIGLIHALEPNEVPGYLSAQRIDRPAFAIKPEHDEDVFYPITFIEPVEANAQAVGLDMAHETNRFEAAKKSRDTGEAQITGPIVLVQDSEGTPGFLFYAPKYNGTHRTTASGRAEHFEGMVYAPFVVKRLMEGVLAQENRHIGIRLTDGSDTIYDELHAHAEDFDPEPMLTTTVRVPMYGRTWSFDIWSSKSFRAAQSNSQPMVILIGGFVIDALLLTSFVLLSRASRRSLAFADEATRELQDRNAELEQFVYTASHDLKSPLISIQGFSGYLRQDIADGRYDRLELFVNRIDDGTLRIRAHIDDLLSLCRVGRVVEERAWIDPAVVIRSLLVEMETQVCAAEAEVTIEPDMPEVFLDHASLSQVLENLLANALKYGKPEQGEFRIEIGARVYDAEVHLYIRDNGPGISEDYHEKIFRLFQRMETNHDGTGVGLAIVKRVAQVHGGRVWVESSPGQGANFVWAIPNQAETSLHRQAA